MKDEFTILDNFIRNEGLRYTPQREAILAVFLDTERHVSAEELHRLLKAKGKGIGYTTVYRAMRLFCEAGLCGEIDFGDGITRYEHKYGHKHHDHLICTQCGSFIEVLEPKIEKMQDDLAMVHGFIPLKHKLQIFGICRKCAKKGKKKG
jgi:Fur family ferric uptake transcriptional regulator